MNARLSHAEALVAARKAKLFNARHPRGARVMYIPAAGETPLLDRVYGAAFVRAGRAVVQLAGHANPVETDRLYTPPELDACPEARLGVWPVLTGFALGVVATIAVALCVPPAKAIAPERIVIDCIEPGDEPVSEAAESRVQA